MKPKSRKYLTLAAVLPIAAFTSLILSGSAEASLSCDKLSLQSAAPPGATITSATHTTLPGPLNTPYCRVLASIVTEAPGPNTVVFEVDLPDSWNSRFAFFGNGGFGGSLQAVGSEGYDFTLAAGFSTAATDTGHVGASFLDGTFLFNNLAGQEDFAFRAVHVSTKAAKTIVAGYYSGAAAHSYFLGCSTGGRQAMVEAQKYPDDYDGIVAGDPAIGNPVAGFNWNDQALLAHPDSWLSPAAIHLVDATVLAACDGKDGVVDGLIQDPSKCHFKPASLQCTNGNTVNCLTPNQVVALQKIYAGAKKGGRQIYPGFTASDPGDFDGWSLWISGFAPPTLGVPEPWGLNFDPFSGGAPFQWTFQDQFLKFGVFSDPDYDATSFSFSAGSDVARLAANVARWSANGVNPNLGRLVHRGHKLLMYHGWSDPALTPLVSVKYYQSLKVSFGGDLDRVRDSVRLFMVPGMHHCSGGPGPNVFDPLTPLVEWVEGGIQPDNLLAAHFTNNDPTKPVDRTMPLCAYPETAHYDGVGPIALASSWSCR